MSRVSAFALLCTAGAFAIFSSTISKSPALPLLAGHLGIPLRIIGIIAAASTVVGIVMNITSGSLSDIYGRKRLLVMAGFFFASAPFLYPLVSRGWQLTLVRAYHGLATATFVPVAMATVADIFPGERGGRMGLFSSSTMVGRLLAPVVGGFLISFGGFRATYLLAGLAGISALALFSQLGVPKTGPQALDVARPRFLSSLKVIASNPRILAGSATQAVLYFTMAILETFLPLYMLLLGLGAAMAGILLSVHVLAIMTLKPIFGTLSDRYGRAGPIMFGLEMSSVGLSVITFSRSPLALLLGTLAYSVGVASTTSSISPLVADLASATSHGSALGMLETVKDVGQASGPIVAGMLIGVLGYRGIFRVASGLLLVNFIPIWLMRRKLRIQGPRSE